MAKFTITNRAGAGFFMTKTPSMVDVPVTNEKTVHLGFSYYAYSADISGIPPVKSGTVYYYDYGSYFRITDIKYDNSAGLPVILLNNLDFRVTASSISSITQGYRAFLKNNDVIAGNRFSDTMRGFEGNDKIFGNKGNDRAYGGIGDDKLFGGAGNDKLVGDGGNDRLQGDAGSDVLIGNRGNDILNGGKGNDTLTGGAGRDTFVFKSPSDGTDTIKDFQFRKDTIRIDVANPQNAALSVTHKFGDTIVKYGFYGKIILEDIILDQSQIDFDLF